MAKKMDSKLEKRIKALGINAKNEEDARKKLLAKLEKEGIEGMEEEDTKSLIEMVESFVEEDVNDNSEEDSEEDEIEELANEIEEETETSDEEDEDDSEDEEDSEEETETEEDSDEDEEDSEEEEEKPAKVQSKKKESKKTEPKKTSKRGVKLDPKNNKEDREVFDELKNLFGEGYQLDWLSSYGLTVKHIGKNGKRGVLTLENATKHDDGRITCNLYLLTMTKETEKLDELGIEYELCWTKAPFMKGITLDEAIEILKKVFEIITGFVSIVDKRLGDNRKKMEENLKKVNKKSKVEEDEEEDEEDEAPVKKPAKKVSKKSKK